MPLLLLIAIGAIVAFIVTTLVTPNVIKWLINKRIIGRDVHKKGKPAKAEMGGIAVILGYSVATLIILPFIEESEVNMPFILLTIFLVALVGLIDDIFELRQSQKALVLMITALPLVWVFQNQTTVRFPLLGTINFGYFYPALMIPLAVTTASNFTNMLAGFNGLEVSTGIMALLTISFSALFLGVPIVAMITLPMAAALAGFIRYNWYPAKIFPGDTGTLVIGATIATAAIVGRMEIVCMATLFPHAIDFALKMLNKNPFSQRSIYGDTKVSSRGILKPAPYPALVHSLLLIKPMTEPELVKAILKIEALYCFIAVIITFITLY